MNCPVCKTELKMAERHEIEIDYCPQCRGVWLDRGELDKIIERTTKFTPRERDDDYRSYDHKDRSEEHDKYDRREDYKRYKRKSFLKDIFDF